MKEQDMDAKLIQQLLASAGYYKGKIDSDLGPMSRAAVEIIERNARVNRKAWSWQRRFIGAGQTVLNAQGHEAGAVDGYAGHNTAEAVASWQANRDGVSAAVPRVPLAAMPVAPQDLPRQSEMSSFYGTPGPGGTVERRLTSAQSPYVMRLDWDLKTTISRIRIHEKCAKPLERALVDILAHYGLAHIRALGIDRFAGSYVARQMRGGSSWSTHAYGCAVDFYAAPNGLRTRCPDALFCKPEYKPFLDIMERHGWLPAIRLWGADAMHFQMARL